ncbi:MAG: DUF6951 family protein [Bacillota bacterium]
MVEINSGICGFTTRVNVRKTDQRTVEVLIETDCPNIKKVTGGKKAFKPLRELFCKLHETETYIALLNGVSHPACLVPAGVLKGIEVESGLALPKDSYIRVVP